MYPWQSGSDGREETDVLYRNPRSGRWMRDHTHLQRHVGSAIAYNVWQYYQVTGDVKFLVEHGAEMLVEIARFWASAATYNPALDRYEICGVMGPDEYHDAYPGADRPGLNNNAYTNVLAAWVLWRAIEVWDLLPADAHRLLCERLAVTESEVAEWDRVSRRLRLVFQADGLLSQFEGYDALLEFEWAAYRRRHGHLYRLDFILEAEGDTTNRYRLSKQPDVLMLFYLFSAEDCRRSSRAWDTRSTGVASRARSTITFSGARATRPSAGSPTRGSSRARTGPGPGTCSRRRFSAMWRISRAGRLPKAFTWAPWLARSTCSSAATRGSSSATTFSGSTRGCPTRCDASGSSSGTGATRSGSTSGAIGSR
jgi:trehalose/maltose hydrolase-like predicted phosphorylase